MSLFESLPSSQVSVPSHRMPSPHVACWQVFVHSSPSTMFMSSPCSSPSAITTVRGGTVDPALVGVGHVVVIALLDALPQHAVTTDVDQTRADAAVVVGLVGVVALLRHRVVVAVAADRERAVHVAEHGLAT